LKFVGPRGQKIMRSANNVGPHVRQTFLNDVFTFLTEVGNAGRIVNTCSTLTHSTNEDLLNIKRKDDAKSRTLSRTSDTTETRNPCVIKVILLACSTYIAIFKFY
jgi:hypothetical protein